MVLLMAWANNGPTDYCKESYSLQVQSDSLGKGTIDVCLRKDNYVQVVSNFNRDRLHKSELLVLGMKEESDSNIEIKSISNTSCILNNDGFEQDNLSSYSFPGLDDKQVPPMIYEFRTELLGIPSKEIIDIICGFAIDDIKPKVPKYYIKE